MSNMSEDVQYAGSDTRPPMFDRTDFESWQQRIRLYYLGKDNGENIMKSITEGPFKMGTFIQTPAEETEGALQLGPERARVFTDLSAEEKERYKADIRATNILLQGIPKTFGTMFMKLINDMRNIKMTMPRMQLNSKFQHEVHASENRMMMERFIQPTNDPLALVSNASVQHSSTDNLIESLTNTLVLLTQSYKLHLPQTNNQLRTSSNARNKDTVQDGRVMVQDVRGR
ncbi:hypothetical protein Tco_1483842 [Tanacetum coccineum]